MKWTSTFRAILAIVLICGTPLMADTKKPAPPEAKKSQTPFEELKAKVEAMTAQIAALEARIDALEGENRLLEEKVTAATPGEKLYEVWGLMPDSDKIQAFPVKATSAAEALRKARSIGIRPPAGIPEIRMTAKGEKEYPTVTIPGDTLSQSYRKTLEGGLQTHR